jgi:alkylhydroperoxidase family enzyme
VDVIVPANEGILPEALAAYAHEVRSHSYRVTDEDVEALRAAGYSDGDICELTVGIALGAALTRDEQGLKVLG